MEKYVDDPALRGIVLAVSSLIPGIGGLVSAADTVASAEVDRIRELRLQTLIHELETGRRPLTRAEVVSEPVLHAAYVTVEATVRTHRREKIRWFARLLLAGLEDPPRLNLAEEHEDYLKILDDLSYREWGILITLAEFEGRYPHLQDETDLQRAERLWDAFTEDVCARFSIPPEELPDLMSRLNRTGAYQTFVGGFLDYEGDRGKLTPTYYRLASLVQLKGQDLANG